MNELKGSLIVQNFGLESKNTPDIIKNLNLFVISNFEWIINQKIFSNLKDDKEKETTIYSSFLFLQLVIERIIRKLVIDYKGSIKSILALNLSNFLFSDYFLYSPELLISKDNNDFLLNDKKFIFSAINLIDDALKEIKMDNINEDIFGDLYQNLIHSITRYQKGEFYTPAWLVKRIVDDIWTELNQIKRQYNQINILDPACGSGSFLILIFNRALKEGYFSSIDEIFESIHGFDINYISLFMIKANLILSITLKFDLIKNHKFNRKINPFNNIDTLAVENSKNSLQYYFKESNKENLFNKYDIIIGNPPWITMKSITNTDYQEKLKKQYFSYKLIEKKQTHLFTQLEMASLFYNKAIDLYLRQNGLICFVMPKSVILSTKQNINFQKFTTPKSKLLKIWDLQNIQNLFGMPACVLFGRKGHETTYPVDLYIFYEIKSTELKNNNKISFETVESKYSSTERNSEQSDYYHKFKVGASIFPRNLYFIQLNSKIDNYLQIITDPTINVIAKNQWKGISLRGSVDEKYLFCTLLAWELLPFGFLHMRLVLLPITINNRQIEITSIKNMDNSSREWFNQANSNWIKYNTEKSKKRFPSLTDRLNYNNLLTKQKFKKFLVLYSGTGTNICSCVISRDETSNFGDKQVPFIADVKTWIFETENEHEAHYLSAILNSSYLNGLIKPLQPQGLGGGRAIHRRPLQFPIKEFDQSNKNHMKLSDLSKNSHKIIKSYISDGTIKTRKDARKLIKKELIEISELTQMLLK